MMSFYAMCAFFEKFNAMARADAAWPENSLQFWQRMMATPEPVIDSPTTTKEKQP